MIVDGRIRRLRFKWELCAGATSRRSDGTTPLLIDFERALAATVEIRFVAQGQGNGARDRIFDFLGQLGVAQGCSGLSL